MTRLQKAAAYIALCYAALSVLALVSGDWHYGAAFAVIAVLLASNATAKRAKP